MHVFGHKLKAVKALEKKRFWEKKIEEMGSSARIKVIAFEKFRKWHFKKVKELKELRK